MPDFAMCAHPTCKLRFTCRRSVDRTEADAWAQSYMASYPLTVDGETTCNGYWDWPKKEDDDA
jgi:hypothetical protein